MNAVGDSKSVLPELKNDGRMHVYLSGNHFQQNKVIIPNNDNVINIYCVYEIDPIASTRDDTFTIQNALFGVVEITKNADTSRYKYKGYGVCFDEGGTFSMGNINNGRNVLIFGVDERSLVHANNKVDNIYVMGDCIVQGINDTTLHAKKTYSQNVLSLHCNGDDSYLFVNGKQELKFKAKTDQLVKEKLCIGNLSDQWTANESENTGLYGNIYDFVVDYQSINGVKPIYDMHRYLMTKRNISPYIYKMLLINLAISLFSILKVKTLEFVSVINEKCMSRPKIIDLNKDELVYYPLSIKVNKYSGDCNNINDSMAKLCVPNIVKDMNINVFNLLARINETRKVV